MDTTVTSYYNIYIDCNAEDSDAEITYFTLLLFENG